jgi:hypothetical protein
MGSKSSGQPVQRGRDARADVGDAGRYPRCGGRDQISAGDIAHGDEVAALFAIAENHRHLPRTELLAQNRDHAGIGRARVLARSIDIEISLAAHREAVCGGVPDQNRLGGELGRAVGTDRAGDGRFGQWQRGIVSIDGGRRGEDDARNPMIPGKFGDPMGGREVQIEVQPRIGNALLHAYEGGEMDDRVEVMTAREIFEGVDIANIGVFKGERRLGAGVGEIFRAARPEIIEAHHGMTGCQQQIAGVTADESRGASDQKGGHAARQASLTAVRKTAVKVKNRRLQSDGSVRTATRRLGLVMAAMAVALSLPLLSAGKTFPVYDAMLYRHKPETSKAGLEPMTGLQDFWGPGNSKEEVDAAAVQTACATRTQYRGPIFLDVEHWPVTEDDGPRTERSLDKLIQVIDLVRAEIPEARLGYYSLMPQRIYWPIINRDAATLRSWHAGNRRSERLAEHVDVIFPSLYTFYDDPIGWERYARMLLLEARRYHKPVYAFLWPDFHDSNERLRGKPIPRAFWRRQLEVCRELADGIVVWGGWQKDWDENALWWVETKDFLKSLK